MSRTLTTLALALLFALPAAADTIPSIWAGIESTEGDGVDGVSPGLVLQAETLVGPWELDARAGARQSEKIEVGDGYALSLRAVGQRWFGRVAPGVSIAGARQVTSRWQKDAAWAVVLVSFRLRAMEFTPEWRQPISGEGLETVGISVELPLAGRWWMRVRWTEASFSEGDAGRGVGLSLGWRKR